MVRYGHYRDTAVSVDLDSDLRYGFHGALADVLSYVWCSGGRGSLEGRMIFVQWAGRTISRHRRVELGFGQRFDLC